MEETTPTFGNTRRNEKGRRRPEIYREEEGQQEDLAMVGERENDNDDNLELGDDLGMVYFKIL